jgi:hypothetical protein
MKEMDMKAWENVNKRKDDLWAKIVSAMPGDAEREILIRLLELEVENRSYAQPRIRGPLRKVVEEKIR